MTDPLEHHIRATPRMPVRWAGPALFGLLGVVLALGGCASGDVKSSIFVDPSKYDLYDCPQLWTARATADKRVIELQSLIAKADTGFAGPVVSGLAYQSDLATAVGQRDLIDQKIAANNCPAQPAAAAAPAQTPAPSKGRTRR